MDKHKVYCSECIFLEEHPTLAEVPIDSGNYIKTGTRFYCPVLQKWFSINTTRKMMEFNWCVYGEQKGATNDKS